MANQRLSPEDLVQCTKLTNPVPHPTKHISVFAARDYAIESNSSRTDLFIVDHLSNAVSQLTHGKANMEPQWGSDGEHIFFMSSRSGAMQVHCMPLSGGEAKQLTSFPDGVHGYKLFQRYGTPMLAVVLEVYADKTPEETATIDKEKAKTGCTGVLFDGLPVRHWDTWGLYEKRMHVFTCQLNIDARRQYSCGAATDLMFGLETDCPGRPFGGTDDFTFSPDGTTCALACRAVGDVSMMWRTAVHIYLTAVPDPASTEKHEPHLRQVSPDNEATQAHPVFSPDGTKLAYLSMTRGGYESDCLRLRVCELANNEQHLISEQIDLSFMGASWASDSSLLCRTQYRGRIHLFLVDIADVNSPQLRYLPGGGSRMGEALHNNEVLFLESSFNSPAVIRSAPLASFVPFEQEPLAVGDAPQTSDPAEVRTMVDMNTKYAEGGVSIFSSHQEFYFAGAHDHPIHAWYFAPPELAADAAPKSVPLLLIIHGGPQGAFLDSWHYRWNLGIMAAQGYAVVAINFHGSTGFGQDFTDSIRGDWGGAPYEDLMLGVDATLAKFAYLDPERVGALGASYGGFMINWVNGHTNRFKCLVNHDGTFSSHSMYYSTEELWFMEWEFHGLPWENPTHYDKWDAKKFVQNWQTPTLVIHGGKDYRVPDCEGIATFTALQRRGVPSKFLFFPNENHWVVNPANSVMWHRTIFEWLQQWLH